MLVTGSACAEACRIGKVLILAFIQTRSEASAIAQVNPGITIYRLVDPFPGGDVRRL
jgi:hypothetical protein